MTVSDWLKASAEQLSQVGITTARLDCLVLLEDTLNTNRTQILAEPDRHLTSVELQKLDKLIHKRARHIPLAQLRGKTEFYGREFIVNKYVLEPRPESETMIDICKTLTLPDHTKIADIGSGTGALGITVALELPAIDLTLLEIDSAALAVSKQNATKHNIRTHLVRNDLLTGLNEQFDVLLCNLPYVPEGFHINTAASHEPALAIFGGPDGLDLYRKLFDQLSKRLRKPHYILTEALPPQHDQLAAIASAAGFSLTRTDDFIQLFEPS